MPTKIGDPRHVADQPRERRNMTKDNRASWQDLQLECSASLSDQWEPLSNAAAQS